MKIRQYNPKDYEAIWVLHNAALESTGAHLGNGPWDDDLKDIEDVYVKNNGEFLVGEVDGQVVAMGALRKVDAETVELKRMRVHPDFQGQGFGKQMMFELERQAKQLGYGKIVLDTTEKQGVAQKLYEKYGYTETRREETPKFVTIFYEKVII